MSSPGPASVGVLNLAPGLTGCSSHRVPADWTVIPVLAGAPACSLRLIRGHRKGRFGLEQGKTIVFDSQSIELGRYFVRSYPRRTALMVGLLILAGLAEGVGLVTLLPLLEIAVGDGSTESGLGRVVEDFLNIFGLDATLGVLLGIIVIGITVKAGFLWLAGNQIGFTTARIATDLRLLLIRALFRARWSYFTGQPVGHVANAIGNEAHRAAGAYREVCSLLAGAVQVLVYLGVALLVSWQVALFALLGAGGIAFGLRRFVGVARRAGAGQTVTAKSLAARMTDVLQGIKPIKAMGREMNVLPLLERETLDLNKALRESVRASETRRALHEPLLVLLIATGLYVAVTMAGQSFSALMVMTFLFYRLAGYINGLQGSYQNLAGSESAFWSLREQVAAAEAEAEKGSVGKRLTLLSRGIMMRDVTFSYGEHKVLDRVSLSVPAGTFVAIVGPSGAGKTTIADLIVGLHRPEEGTILVDDVSVEELSVEAWRHMIGYVPQEMLLFHDSVLRNVTLGDDEIPRDDVWAALAKAGARDFVQALPDDLDTVIGERGTKLSGGQRQRIAVARALVRKPGLLVLDEVTTALDPRTEAELCATLKALEGEVTIVAVSHQPALMAVADMVYRLENGSVELERAASSRAAVG